MNIVWAVVADFDRDTTYEFDLTPYIAQPAGGLNVSRGLNEDGQYVISTLTMGLNNSDGTFTPENTASAIYGQMRPGTPVKVVATHDSTEYTLWAGYIHHFATAWAAGTVPTCTATCYDIAKYLQDYIVNVTVSAARDTDGALVAIMDEMGLTSDDRNFDDGIQALPYHWARSQSALEAMADATRCEMGGFLYVAGDGRVRFESRQSRLGVTPDQTWGDGTSIFPQSEAYILSEDDLVSQVSVVASAFSTGPADIEVYRFSRGADSRGGHDSIAIAQGKFYEFEVDYGSPVLEITTPVATTDYTANAASDGSSTDRTANLTVEVTNLGAGARVKLTNTFAGTIFVTKFRIRGLPITIATQPLIFTASKSLVGAKSDMAVELRVPFNTDSQAVKDYAYATLRTYRYPYPTLIQKYSAGRPDATEDTDRKNALLSLEIGDLIYYKNTGITTSASMVDDWWYVESITHTIPPDFAGKSFDTQVSLVPSYLYRNLDICAYDLFTRANASGDLGSSVSGDTWADDTGFDITSNAAVPNATTLQTPVIDLTEENVVVEVTVSGIAA